MKSFLLTIFLLLSFVLRAQGQGAAPSGAVAVKDEPHHHLLIENTYVRVYRFDLPGHEATLLHEHALPYLTLTLGHADYIDAAFEKPETHVTLDDALTFSKGGIAHIVRTDAGSPFHNLEVELLRPQGTPRNRCSDDPVVEGPPNCDEDETRKVLWLHCALEYYGAGDPYDCPLPKPAGKPVVEIPAFESDELLIDEVVLPRGWSYSATATRSPRLILVIQVSADVSIQVPGADLKTLRPGDAFWLPGGSSATVTNVAAEVKKGKHKEIVPGTPEEMEMLKTLAAFGVVTFKD